MATWGAYFASYVKKGDAAPKVTSEATQEAQPPPAKPTAAKVTKTTTTASTDGFKRSNSTAKKLYEIPAEFPKELPQRSTSNAARVAKLFGYANPASAATPAPATEKLAGIVVQAVALEEKTREEAKRSSIIVQAAALEEKAKEQGKKPGVLAGFFAKKPPAVNNDVKEEQPSESLVTSPPNLPSNVTPVEPIAVADTALDTITALKANDQSNISSGPTTTIGDNDRNSQTIPQITNSEESQPKQLSGLNSGSSITSIRAPESDTTVGPEGRTGGRSKATGRNPSTSKIDDIQAMLNSFASQAPGMSNLNPELPKLSSRTEIAPSQSQPKRGPRSNQSSISKLDDIQLMLDSFASQAPGISNLNQEPYTVPGKGGVPPSIPQPQKVMENRAKNDATITVDKMEIKPKQDPSSRRKESLGMLDFFASQAGATSTTPEPLIPAPKKADALSSSSMLEKKLPPASRRNKSLELLDFFANQAMSTISEDKPLGQQGNGRNMTLGTLPEDKAIMEPRKTLEGITNLQVDTKILQATTDLARPQGKAQEKVGVMRKEQTTVSPISTKSPIGNVVAYNMSPLVSKQESIFSPVKRSLSSGPGGNMDPPQKRAGSSRLSSSSSDLSASMDKEDTEIEESTVDFRERFLEYEKQAEQIRLEKEQMEREHERMLEEMSMFQKEADRIAEEEEAMRKFVENLEAERVRDMENEERKRKEREARLEAERLEREARLEAERLEMERIENERLEQERLAREEEERIQFEAAERARLAKAEADRLRAEAEETERRVREARLEQERIAQEEEMRINAEIEEAKRRKMEARMEEERLAREEVERLNAEMLRYAEEAEADRRLMEEEEEREEAERLEAERLEEEEALERERLREEQEEEEYERQREEDERFARQQRRAAREEAERLQYEQEMAEEEARYAEQERRAEMKRRREEEEARYIEQERRAEQRRREEEARYAEQDRLAAGLQGRGREEVMEDDSDEEDEIVKAERKIKEAFAGLARERGQAPPPAPIKRSNTAQATTQRPPDRGAMVRRQEMDTRVSRNNTVGARPQLPRKDQPMMRENTTSGRPQIRGGLPSGPRRRN